MTSETHPDTVVRQAGASLPWILFHLLADGEMVVPLPELAVATGQAFHIAVHAEQPLIEWSGFGIDAYLIETARLYGVHLRPLHPRPAADGLLAAPEYQEHFIDSYLPLIRRALSHNEPVLAWRGWATPHEANWGIIEMTGEEGLGFKGRLPDEPQAQPLVAASTQCYVVESVVPQRPSTEAAAACAHAATRAMAKEAARVAGWCAGATAWDLWARRMQRDRGMSGLIAHRAFADTLRHRRRLSHIWLTTWRPTAPETAKVDAIASLLDDVIGALTDVSAALPERPDDALASVERGREADQAAWNLLESWVPAPAEQAKVRQETT